MIWHERLLQNNNHIHDYGYRECNSLSLIVERNLGPSSSCPYSPNGVERLSGNSYARANRLTISLVIAA